MNQDIENSALFNNVKTKKRRKGQGDNADKTKKKKKSKKNKKGKLSMEEFLAKKRREEEEQRLKDLINQSQVTNPQI